MLLTGAIATIFTVFSIVNSAGSAINVKYEKEVVGEAVKNMHDTSQYLRDQHVYTDPDKDDRRIKRRIADKLKNSANYLGSEVFKKDMKNKKALVHDVSKTVLMEFGGRAAEEYLLTEVSKQAAKTFVKDVIIPVNIATGVVDSAIMAKSAWGTDSGFEGKYFGQLARPSENINLDLQIAQIKAQKLVKDTQKLNADMRQMMLDFGIDPDNPEGTKDPEPDNVPEPDVDTGDGDYDDWDDGDWDDGDWDDGDWDDGDWDDGDWDDGDWDDGDWDDGDWDDDYWDDGDWDDDYWDDGDWDDDYYDSDEWKQITDGIGFDPDWDAGGDVPVDDYDYDDYDYDDYGDDDYGDDGGWDDDVYMPDPAAVDPGYYDDPVTGGEVGGGEPVVDPNPAPVDTGSSSSGGTTDAVPCDPSEAFCGLDMDL